jgi:hypothetical protein
MPSLRADGGQSPTDRFDAKRIAGVACSTPLIGFVIGVLTWPMDSITPSTGPDPSWVTGLYLAFERGMHFGTEVIFTYGPLGFIEVPSLQDSGLWMIGIVYQSALHVAIAITVLWAARRALPLVAAIGLTYVALIISPLPATVVVLAFIWCFAALSDRAPGFALPLVVFGGASLTAIELLGKANYGVSVLVFCSLAVVGARDRRHNVPWFAGIALAGFLVLWFGAQQGLSNLPEFISNSIQIISGYSRAMSNDVGDVAWERPYALIAIALLVGGAVLATRGERAPQRAASLALVATFAFLSFKQGFVRQGPGGSSDFFALMLIAAIGISWRLPERLGRLPSRLPAVALFAPMLAMAIATMPIPFGTSLKPADHLSALGEQAHAFASRGERERIRDEASAEMRSLYALDRRTLELIGDEPVHIDPWEIGVAWIYGLNWHPLPTVQDYSAYTQKLDQINARALSTPDGPARILRQNAKLFVPNIPDSSIDGRYAAWDPPAQHRAMLCHYEAVYTTERWQVLDRVPNRCGPPRLIETVQSETEREIDVPVAAGKDEVVFARLHGAGVEGWESMRSMLYRARQRTVTLDGYAVWRLVPDTAGDGLLMRVPKSVDYPEPFQAPFDAQTMSVQIQGAAPRPLSVEFFSQHVQPLRTASKTPRQPAG